MKSKVYFFRLPEDLSNRLDKVISTLKIEKAEIFRMALAIGLLALENVEPIKAPSSVESESPVAKS
jgi:predicted DNA-binding protein